VAALAVGSLRDGVFPRWSGYVSAVFAVVLTLLGVLALGLRRPSYLYGLSSLGLRW